VSKVIPKFGQLTTVGYDTAKRQQIAPIKGGQRKRQGMAPRPKLVTIPNSEVRTLASSIVNQTFKICVALPGGYDASDELYPVLYLLDANGFFGMVTETARMLQILLQAPEMLVVGIGYPVDGFQGTQGLRVRDLTPTPDSEWVEGLQSVHHGQLAVAGSGGAGQFLSFITEELTPFVRSNYRADPENAAIAGHSFGGLFALYALFHATDAINRYLISSPSIWWDPAAVRQFEADYAVSRSDLPAKVFMSAGTQEEDLVPPFRDAPAAFVSHVRSFAAHLRKRGYDGLELTTQIFEDESHVSVVPGAMSRGLRVIFR
jgi:predicted alpha/beta superfamily hydrolase